MLCKVAKFLSQTVRYLRSSAGTKGAKRQQSRSLGLSESASDSSDWSFESAQSEPANSESPTHLNSKMSRQPSKFELMCRSFETRLENAKMAKEKVLIQRSAQVNETILIDDEMQVEITSLTKNKPTDAAKKELQLFANVTGKLQNAQQNEEICLSDDENCLKSSIKITEVNLNVQPQHTKPPAIGDVELSVKELFDEELKKSFKSLKPENYRIQQVIKAEALVFFDLETGGMGYKEDILQIGALNHEGKQFNMYCTPTRPIPGMASRVHHITYKDGQLYYRKNPVKHQPLIEVLLHFCEYLNKIKSNNIVLVAHNANFDRRFLIDKMHTHHLQGRLNGKVLGFLDTMPLFRRLVPGQASYKQNALVYTFFPKVKTDFHNALNDVIYLKKLFEKVATKKMREEPKYVNDFSQTLEYGLLKKEQHLIEELGKKRKAIKDENNRAMKRKSSAAIYIDGEPVKRAKRERKPKSEPALPSRRSRRLTK